MAAIRLPARTVLTRTQRGACRARPSLIGAVLTTLTAVEAADVVGAACLVGEAASRVLRARVTDYEGVRALVCVYGVVVEDACEVALGAKRTGIFDAKIRRIRKAIWWTTDHRGRSSLLLQHLCTAPWRREEHQASWL